MTFNFKNELKSGLLKFDISLDEEAMERLEFYFIELKKWSKKVNLIAKNTSDIDIVENHFIDSLVLLKFLKPSDNLVDIGTGAGLPGLICKAARPDIEVDLVEPRTKRVMFMNHVIRGLKLDGVQVYEARIEDTELANKSSVTHLTSRAVADIEGFIEMTSSFGRNVKRVCLKGPKWQEELSSAKDSLVQHGLEKDIIFEYELPKSKATRSIVVLK